MAYEGNLIPFSERTKEEARENGRKGGIASGAARRRKKSLREAADLYLSMAPTDKRICNELSCAGIGADDIDNQMAVIVALSQKAMTGDPKAAKVLIDLMGEDQKGGIPATSSELCDLTDEQLREMIMQAEE